MLLSTNKIWVPDSFSDKQLVGMNRAVREYDERLFFGRNEDTGDWCVFVKMPLGTNPVAIIGFGQAQANLPDTQHVVTRLREIDAQTRGTDILDNVRANNERITRENNEKIDQIEWQAAEGWESYLHRSGKTPYHRSLPKKDPKQKGTA